MEGLIAHVYKAIKRRATRNKYRCLSSTGAVNLPTDDDVLIGNYCFKPQEKRSASVFGNGGLNTRRDQFGHHRRSNSSAVNLRGGELGYCDKMSTENHYYPIDDDDDRSCSGYTYSYNSSSGPRQLVRFMSQR